MTLIEIANSQRHYRRRRRFGESNRVHEEQLIVKSEIYCGDDVYVRSTSANGQGVLLADHFPGDKNER